MFPASSVVALLSELMMEPKSSKLVFTSTRKLLSFRKEKTELNITYHNGPADGRQVSVVRPSPSGYLWWFSFRRGSEPSSPPHRIWTSPEEWNLNRWTKSFNVCFIWNKDNLHSTKSVIQYLDLDLQMCVEPRLSLLKYYVKIFISPVLPGCPSMFTKRMSELRVGYISIQADMEWSWPWSWSSSRNFWEKMLKKKKALLALRCNTAHKIAVTVPGTICDPLQ